MDRHGAARPLGGRHAVRPRQGSPRAGDLRAGGVLNRSSGLKRTRWRRRAPTGPVSGRPALERAEYARTTHQQVLELDGYRCVVPFCRIDKRLQVDHVLPRSQGGPDISVCMLATLCERCNKLKEDGLLIILPNLDTTTPRSFRIFDLRAVVACEVCFKKIAAGELIAVPSRAGAVRWVTAS